MYKDILWNALYRNARYMCIILVANIMTILTAPFIGTFWPPNRTFNAQKNGQEELARCKGYFDYF